MKKIITVLLITVSVIFSFAGCGEKKCDICGESKTGVKAFDDGDGGTENWCENCYDKAYEIFESGLEELNDSLQVEDAE